MRKQPDFRIFFGLAAVALVVGGFLVYSQWNAVSENRDHVESLQKEVDDAAGVRKELEASEQRLNDLRVKLAHLEKGVPDYRYIPTMLKELEEFGNANGIQVTGVRPTVTPPSAKPDEKETRKAYDEIGIEVKGRGTYADGLRFLKALHRFPKVVAARSVSVAPKVSSTDDPMGSPKLEWTVELKVFVFPDKDPAMTLDGDKPSTPVATQGVGTNG